MKRGTHFLMASCGALLLAVMLNGCSALKGLPSALSDLKRLQFKLDNVNNFSLNGVNLQRAASKGEINLMDIGRLTSAFATRSLPAQFTLNVAVRNPNDGTAGRPATNLFLRRISWTLLIDDRTTINGVTDQRLEVPGTGQTAIIPITMNLDLYKFFGDRGFDDLLNLALAIGGAQGSSSRLKLTARAMVEVPPLAAFEYPGDITIVNTSFSNP